MLSTLITLSLVLSNLTALVATMKEEAKIKKESVEKIDQLTFNKLPIELQKVALCESGGKHYWGNETIKSKTGDLGIMQINEKVHNQTAEKLGLNLHNPNDNMKYALYLYEKEGLRPWFASRLCWKK